VFLDEILFCVTHHYCFSNSSEKIDLNLKAYFIALSGSNSTIPKSKYVITSGEEIRLQAGIQLRYSPYSKETKQRIQLLLSLVLYKYLYIALKRLFLPTQLR
jgi:hypothetical protein